MKTQTEEKRWVEKPASGWWNGVNSSKNPWILADTQFRWGVNVMCRGGIVQTRPGYRMRLTLPTGNLQGMALFLANKEDADHPGDMMMIAVAGKVYALPFPLVQPDSWESVRLKTISFNPKAQNVYWAACEKTVVEASTGDLTIVPSYSIMIMQDGSSPAAYYDGKNSGHLDESKQQTPRGSWMKWVGNRLWIARGNYVLASNFADPLLFKERVSGAGRGDLKFDRPVTGLALSLSGTGATTLIVFTESTTSAVKATVTNRDEWANTENFNSIIIPSVGCSAGRSIVNHAGLLWWYSAMGLMALDPAASYYLSSQIKSRDSEMARTRSILSDDLSVVAGCNFENCLLMSVPAGDTLNAHTMVLDYQISTEWAKPVDGNQPPAWDGVWTGTRPVEWATAAINGQRRIFYASADYQSINGSENHVWEAFMDDRFDVYEEIDSSNAKRLIKNPIFCEFETKLLGDGLDLKVLRYAMADLVEIGGNANFKMSYCGTYGPYIEIGKKRIVATQDSTASSSDELSELESRIGSFRVQSRRFISQEVNRHPEREVENERGSFIGKNFGLLMQWCGRLGVEAVNLFMEPFVNEESRGKVEAEETGIRVLSQDGVSFFLDGESGQSEKPEEENVRWVSPVTPRFRSPFYSSIALTWTDPNSQICLDCARDSSSPPSTEPVTIGGKVVR